MSRVVRIFKAMLLGVALLITLGLVFPKLGMAASVYFSQPYSITSWDEYSPTSLNVDIDESFPVQAYFTYNLFVSQKIDSTEIYLENLSKRRIKTLLYMKDNELSSSTISAFRDTYNQFDNTSDNLVLNQYFYFPSRARLHNATEEKRLGLIKVTARQLGMTYGQSAYLVAQVTKDGYVYRQAFRINVSSIDGGQYQSWSYAPDTHQVTIHGFKRNYPGYEYSVYSKSNYLFDTITKDGDITLRATDAGSTGQSELTIWMKDRSGLWVRVDQTMSLSGDVSAEVQYSASDRTLTILPEYRNFSGQINYVEVRTKDKKLLKTVYKSGPIVLSEDDSFEYTRQRGNHQIDLYAKDSNGGEGELMGHYKSYDINNIGGFDSATVDDRKAGRLNIKGAWVGGGTGSGLKVWGKKQPSGGYLVLGQGTGDFSLDDIPFGVYSSREDLDFMVYDAPTGTDGATKVDISSVKFPVVFSPFSQWLSDSLPVRWTPGQPLLFKPDMENAKGADAVKLRWRVTGTAAWILSDELPLSDGQVDVAKVLEKLGYGEKAELQFQIRSNQTWSTWSETRTLLTQRGAAQWGASQPTHVTQGMPLDIVPASWSDNLGQKAHAILVDVYGEGINPDTKSAYVPSQGVRFDVPGTNALSVKAESLPGRTDLAYAWQEKKTYYVRYRLDFSGDGQDLSAWSETKAITVDPLKASLQWDVSTEDARSFTVKNVKLEKPATGDLWLRDGESASNEGGWLASSLSPHPSIADGTVSQQVGMAADDASVFKTYSLHWWVTTGSCNEWRQCGTFSKEPMTFTLKPLARWDTQAVSPLSGEFIPLGLIWAQDGHRYAYEGNVQDLQVRARPLPYGATTGWDVMPIKTEGNQYFYTMESRLGKYETQFRIQQNGVWSDWSPSRMVTSVAHPSGSYVASTYDYAQHRLTIQGLKIVNAVKVLVTDASGNEFDTVTTQGDVTLRASDAGALSQHSLTLWAVNEGGMKVQIGKPITVPADVSAKWAYDARARTVTIQDFEYRNYADVPIKWLIVGTGGKAIKTVSMASTTKIVIDAKDSPDNTSTRGAHTLAVQVMDNKQVSGISLPFEYDIPNVGGFDSVEIDTAIAGRLNIKGAWVGGGTGSGFVVWGKKQPSGDYPLLGQGTGDLSLDGVPFGVYRSRDDLGFMVYDDLTFSKGRAVVDMSSVKFPLVFKPFAQWKSDSLPVQWSRGQPLVFSPDLSNARGGDVVRLRWRAHGTSDWVQSAELTLQGGRVDVSHALEGLPDGITTEVQFQVRANLTWSEWSQTRALKVLDAPPLWSNTQPTQVTQGLTLDIVPERWSNALGARAKGVWVDISAEENVEGQGERYAVPGTGLLTLPVDKLPADKDLRYAWQERNVFYVRYRLDFSEDGSQLSPWSEIKAITVLPLKATFQWEVSVDDARSFIVKNVKLEKPATKALWLREGKDSSDEGEWLYSSVNPEYGIADGTESRLVTMSPDDASIFRTYFIHSWISAGTGNWWRHDGTFSKGAITFTLKPFARWDAGSVSRTVGEPLEVVPTWNNGWYRYAYENAVDALEVQARKHGSASAWVTLKQVNQDAGKYEYDLGSQIGVFETRFRLQENQVWSNWSLPRQVTVRSAHDVLKQSTVRILDAHGRELTEHKALVGDHLVYRVSFSPTAILASPGLDFSLPTGLSADGPVRLVSSTAGQFSAEQLNAHWDGAAQPALFGSVKAWQMSAGQRIVLDVPVHVVSQGEQPMTAYVLARLSPTLSGKIFAPPLIIPTFTQGLELVQSVDKAEARPGEVLHYTMHYVNRSSEPLHDVLIRVPLPDDVVLAPETVGCEPDTPEAHCEIILPDDSDGVADELRWKLEADLGVGLGGEVFFDAHVRQ